MIANGWYLLHESEHSTQVARASKGYLTYLAIQRGDTLDVSKFRDASGLPSIRRRITLGSHYDIDASHEQWGEHSAISFTKVKVLLRSWGVFSTHQSNLKSNLSVNFVGLGTCFNIQK